MKTRKFRWPGFFRTQAAMFLFKPAGLTQPSPGQSAAPPWVGLAVDNGSLKGCHRRPDIEKPVAALQAAVWMGPDTQGGAALRVAPRRGPCALESSRVSAEPRAHERLPFIFPVLDFAMFSHVAISNQNSRNNGLDKTGWGGIMQHTIELHKSVRKLPVGTKPCSCDPRQRESFFVEDR